MRTRATRSKPSSSTSSASRRPKARSNASASAAAKVDADLEVQTDSAASELFWTSPNSEFQLLRGDSREILAELPEESKDVIFADPPYFLSNGGSTCRSGKRTSVDKGKWDKSQGPEENHAFNRDWLSACQRLLKPNGTIWVSGTSHVIFSVGFAMQQLGFKILNEIIWEKPNPPPNLSCRYFTHSTEIVLWAAKSTKSRHYFDYPQMKEINGGKQMKNVWRFTAPGKQEKLHGRHPTQKPLGLIERLLRASCPEGGEILDPFNGSGTTGIAAARQDLSYTGIDLDPEYLELTRKRLEDERPEWFQKKAKNSTARRHLRAVS